MALGAMALIGFSLLGLMTMVLPGIANVLIAGMGLAALGGLQLALARYFLSGIRETNDGEESRGDTAANGGDYSQKGKSNR